MDEKHKVAITRLGDRIRVGGMAELDGYSAALHPRRRATLEHVVSDLYPAGGDASAGAFWSGLRPMTPDGPPVIGRAKFRNLWLNTGHGTLGWTMACGSGRVLADLVSGRAPAIDARDLGLDRYGRTPPAPFPRRRKFPHDLNRLDCCASRVNTSAGPKRAYPAGRCSVWRASFLEKETSRTAVCRQASALVACGRSGTQTLDGTGREGPVFLVRAAPQL